MESFIRKSIAVSKIELACYVNKGEGALVHKNRSSYGVVLPVSGKSEYLFDGGKKISSVPGQILFLPKFSNYSISGMAGDCFAINFSMNNEEKLEAFAFKVKNKEMFMECFKSAEAAWKTKVPGYKLKCMAHLYQILYGMRKEFEQGYISKGGREMLEPATEYIHSHYSSEIITVPYLAEICGVSETYFRRIFQKAYGISPLKYINRLRISRARELLGSGMYSVAEVSFLSGFNDEAYFSREFKKAVGVCPSEYLKEL